MNCSKVEHLLSAYIDSELSGNEMIKVRRHLDNCQECQIVEQELRSLKQMLMECPVSTNSIDLSEKILSAIESENKQVHRSFVGRGIMAAIAGTAIVLFALSLSTGPTRSYKGNSLSKGIISNSPPENVSLDQVHNGNSKLPPENLISSTNARVYYQESDPLAGPITPVLYAER